MKKDCVFANFDGAMEARDFCIVDFYVGAAAGAANGFQRSREVGFHSCGWAADYGNADGLILRQDEAGGFGCGEFIKALGAGADAAEGLGGADYDGGRILIVGRKCVAEGDALATHPAFHFRRGMPCELGVVNVQPGAALWARELHVRSGLAAR